MKNGINPPVMLLFFNRPEQFAQVFEWVRRVKPPVLFLVQDGARKNRPDDIENIKKCREIAENIDWECEVYKNYSEENLTCDHREFTGISWCFQYTDRLIILEDDCVPSDSYYPFCAELLERYKDDQRIHTISPINRINRYENGYDYVFSKADCGYGWATWKRVWEDVEKNKDFDFLKDEKACRYLEKNTCSYDKKYTGSLTKKSERLKELQEKLGRIYSWEFLVALACRTEERLAIAPAVNMVNYIGITEDATHCAADPRLLPRKIRKVLTQPAYDIEFPIKHPPFILRDEKFEKLSAEMIHLNPFLSKAEVFFRKLFFARGELKKSIMRRFSKGSR